MSESEELTKEIETAEGKEEVAEEYIEEEPISSELMSLDQLETMLKISEILEKALREAKYTEAVKEIEKIKKRKLIRRGIRRRK